MGIDRDEDLSGLQCVSGVVTVQPPDGVGVVLGQIRPRLGEPIRLRQVVGPAGGPVSLTEVVGRTATVCGQFIVEDELVLLNVRRVIPSGIMPLALILGLLLLLLGL